jgi:hypothetical protein
MMTNANRFQYAVIAVNCALSYATMYMLRYEFGCGESDIIECNFWNRHIWLTTFIDLAVFSAPGMVALYIARDSTAFLTQWTIGNLFWTSFVFNNFRNHAFHLDSHNGCEDCDFLPLLMMVFGVTVLCVLALYRALSDKAPPR